MAECGREMEVSHGEGSCGVEVDGVRGMESNVVSAPGLEIVAVESSGAAAQIQEGTKGQGKTCHQCRQRKQHFAATCKAMKKRGLCPLSYCQTCLQNRYGEVADDVAQDENWNCPKCRGVCNCSMCRKRKGEMPTGILAFAAKASGCSSVSDLLNKGPEMVAAAQRLASATPSKGNLKRPLHTEGGADELQGQGPAKLKVKRTASKSAAVDKSLRTESPEIVLPRGGPITTVAGVELEAQDVGPALHFSEFCSQFAEVLGIQKGLADKVLQDITGHRELRLVPSLVADLHIKLLTVIKPDIKNKKLLKSKDKGTWIKEMGKYISNSAFLKELPVNCLNEGLEGYKNLSPSCKLDVLNFLCDETLSSEKLRTWIMEQKVKADARISAAREKISAAREMEKKLKEKQSDMAKATLLEGGGETPSSEEINNVISQIEEAKQAKEAAINALQEEVIGVSRTKPVIVDQGVAYWKLHGYCNGTKIVRQEFNDDILGNKGRWYIFTEDEEKIIEDYLAKKSRHRSRNHTQV